MIEEIKLPEISENVESGNVVSVLVKAGDTVSENDALIEIETDKAAVEVPSTASGTVSEVLVSEGQDVAVGATIVKVDTEGGGGGEAAAETEAEGGAKGAEKAEAEAPAESAEEPSAETAQAGKAEEKPAAAADKKAAAEKGEATEPAAGAPAGKTAAGGSAAPETEVPEVQEQLTPVPASPSTRRLAREIGVDIHRVQGTGPGGRISEDDVKKHAKQVMQGAGPAGGAAAGGLAGEPELPDFSRWGNVRREPMSKVRKITAGSMQQSWQTIPHVTQFDKADVTDLEAFRKKYAPLAEKAGGKLTVTAILLKIVSEGLQRFPDFNASIDMNRQEIVYKDFVNIGVAVDTDRGLLVPVVQNVPEKSIVQLSVELSEIARKARDKKIKPDEMEGGNFTISNLGGIGGTAFTPVVYSPQVAILGVARAETQPVYQDGEFVPRLILPLSLSYDHRLIDGANGARFLRWIAQSMENPLFIHLQGAWNE
jgi:pyruvate dehydrogenase E2 component (dihydrolipoamide acetyltransferase)